MSRHKIRPQLLLEVDREELHGTPGTARLNHQDCPAGTDLRRRLYVTHKDDGGILGYCHNCGATGRATAGGPRLRVLPGGHVPQPPPIPEAIPLTRRHRAYLEAYGIDDPRDCASVEGEDAIVFCNGDPLNSDYLQTGTVRSFEKGTPKWCKYGGLVAIQYLAVLGGSEHMEPIKVYCEDPISAMKLNELPGVLSCAALSTHIHQSVFKCETATALVWFDNDSDIVRQHAAETAAKLTLRGTEVVLILGVSDPKKYSKAFLCKVINDAIELSRTPKAPDQSYHVLQVQPPNQGVRA